MSSLANTWGRGCDCRSRQSSTHKKHVVEGDAMGLRRAGGVEGMDGGNAGRIFERCVMPTQYGQCYLVLLGGNANAGRNTVAE